jgi:TonB family protein
MDTARALGHSVSLATHAFGAALIGLGPLLVSSRLPDPPGLPGCVLAQVRLSLGVAGGVGGPGSGGRRSPLPPRPSRLAVPTATPVLVPEATLDLAGGVVIAGWPSEGLPGEIGSCLFACGPEGAPGPSVDAALPTAPSRPSRVRVGGDVREPRKVRHVAPVYPPLAVAARVQGRVMLECVIAEDGRVTEVSPLSGHPLLDAAAAEAVRQWRYTPTLLNGVPVSVALRVVVDFRLR